jgi:hypothetical protein
MDTSQILAEIDLEIQRLERVKAFLDDTGVKHRATQISNASPSGSKRRVLSAEARARIATAQKRRWAKAKKAKS